MKYIVRVKETVVTYYDYEVEADSEEEAKEDYAGFECIDEEVSDLENDLEVVDVWEKEDEND